MKPQDAQQSSSVRTARPQLHPGLTRYRKRRRVHAYVRSLIGRRPTARSLFYPLHASRQDDQRLKNKLPYTKIRQRELTSFFLPFTLSCSVTQILSICSRERKGQMYSQKKKVKQTLLPTVPQEGHLPTPVLGQGKHTCEPARTHPSEATSTQRACSLCSYLHRISAENNNPLVVLL